jgi:hypothetical protein
VNLVLFVFTLLFLFFLAWEKQDLAKNPIDLVSVGLVDDSNVYEWEILIMGPDGTFYEGGKPIVFPEVGCSDSRSVPS